jgi:hypothetical protein
MWKADHSFVHPSHSLDHSQTPCTTLHIIYCHHITTIHCHQLTMNFNRWNFFLPLKNECQNTFYPLFQYSCHFKILLCLFISSEVLTVTDTCTYWTYACQLSVETLSAGIKYWTLLFELPSYLTCHNTRGLCMENWKHKKNKVPVWHWFKQNVKS